MAFVFSSPGVVHCGGVVYAVPLVTKWVVDCDFRLFTTPGWYTEGV